MILTTENASPAQIAPKPWQVGFILLRNVCCILNSNPVGQRFTSRDDLPYCAECFAQLFSKRCTACSKPITGECLHSFLCIFHCCLLRRVHLTKLVDHLKENWFSPFFVCQNCDCLDHLLNVTQTSTHFLKVKLSAEQTLSRRTRIIWPSWPRDPALQKL